MRKISFLLITALTLSLGEVIFAQDQLTTVAVDDNGITINSVVVNLPAEDSLITKLLGKPDRTDNKKVNVILTWDKLGITGYKAKNSNKINTLDIVFKPGEFDFSPRRVFKGEITFYSHILSGNTKKQDLQKSNFIVDPEDDTWWDAEAGYLYLIAVLSEDYSGLSDVEIGVK